jgi:threonine aldolase
MAPSTIELNPQGLAQPLQHERNEHSFQYIQTGKLKNALDKAGRDFRSDVVTVPTEGMMQVRLALVNFIRS